MRQMIRYSNGEQRVIDLESMNASEFLSVTECDASLADYNLDCDFDERDRDPDFEVIR